MKKKKFYLTSRLLILILSLSIISLGFIEGDKSSNKKTTTKIYKNTSTLVSGKQGDSYRLKINNISLPLNRKGNIAEVNILPEGSSGRYNGKVFLFASGFFLSGYANGQLFSNAVAPASLVEDYVPGTVANGQNDPRAQIYVVNAQDVPFSQSWLDWKDAVALGADFIDGDGDGVYNPIDKNGNVQWDPDEDMPDLLGDETVWCVYNDGLPAPQRRWNTISPLGIEVRQTVFGFASSGPLGNIVFVRYRFKYVGLGSTAEPDALDDVYFGVWADSDIGEGSSDSADDLVGCDTVRNAGYTYNNGDDGDWGINPPCFMIDFFSGPSEYVPGVTFTDINGNGEYDEGVDIPLDTAYSYRGVIKGIKSIPGARNLPISSFVQYRNGDPTLNDPDKATEARNYILGLNRTGQVIDPCTFSYGAVRGGVECNSVDPRFWYSGDPVANSGTGLGWINTVQSDTRQMTNAGPFKLRKGEEKEIVVAYVVGQGNDPIESITVARNIDDGAQIVFNNNFLAPSPPSPVDLKTEAGEEFITLTWDTYKQVTDRKISEAYDLRFEGFRVWAFKTNNPSEFVNGQQNSNLVASYALNNFIQDLYLENSRTGGIELLYPNPPANRQLDPELYADPQTGKIRIRINNDPFNSTQPLVKGKPYYFAVTSYSINYDALVPRGVGTIGDTTNYYLSSAAFVQNSENIKDIKTIIYSEDLYNPPLDLQTSNQISGTSDGNVKYIVVDKNALTGDSYSIEFFPNDTARIFSMFWRLVNTTTGQVLLDSSSNFNFDSTNVSGDVYQGFIPKVKGDTARIGTASYTGEVWYDPLSSSDETGIYYVGTDIPGGRAYPFNASSRSRIISADKLRKVEIRFGTNSKAYRYVNGFVGTTLTKRSSYVYAGGVTTADTVGGKGPMGKFGEGFVDVPFSAWVMDDRIGEERQLAVGFVERSSTLGGNPDGNWDPGDSLKQSAEVIIVFDLNYDPNGGKVQYTGNATKWADIVKGYDLVDPAATPEQIAIAKSPWFDAMYIIGMQRRNSTSFYSDGDKLTIPIQEYPYTTDDVFSFTTPKSGELTDQQKKELFNKVNVFPNPMYGYNVATSYTNSSPDDPFVTFSNLPEDVTIKIYSLSGTHLRSLTTADKTSPASPFLRWDLKNESGLRVASGLYIAIVSSPQYGDKVLKFSIIMPQKQLPRY